MSRSDIIKKLTERIYGNVTVNNIQQVTQFCDVLVEIFTEALVGGDKIMWKGFLSAEVVEHGQRCGRHPQTNEVVMFPPSKSVKCKISKAIKDMVNEK